MEVALACFDHLQGKERQRIKLDYKDLSPPIYIDKINAQQIIDSILYLQLLHASVELEELEQLTLIIIIILGLLVKLVMLVL